MLRRFLIAHTFACVLLQVVSWVEDVSSLPACPAIARLLHRVSLLRPSDKRWCAWCAPLLAAACAASTPAAPIGTWLHAVHLAGSTLSTAAALELCLQAVNTHPSCRQLWDALAQLRLQLGE